MATKEQLAFLEVFDTSRPPNPLYCHQEFLEKLAEHGRDSIGFLRPDSGGRDVFFHISRLNQGQASDLVPGMRVIYELGMDRTGKMAASSLRVVPAET